MHAAETLTEPMGVPLELACVVLNRSSAEVVFSKVALAPVVEASFKVLVVAADSGVVEVPTVGVRDVVALVEGLVADVVSIVTLFVDVVDVLERDAIFV